MTDSEQWSAAVAATAREYGLLPGPLRLRVGEIAAEIAVAKEAYQSLASTVDAELVCAECKGLCCGHGKHHFTVVDLLVYLSTGRELFSPRFDNPVCPYHTGGGCLMEPSHRPFNCIIFLCDRLEDVLPERVELELAALETELRRLYICLEQLLGNRFANGLLIVTERVAASGGLLFNY